MNTELLNETVPLPKRLIRDSSLLPQDKVVFAAISLHAKKQNSIELLPTRCIVTEDQIADTANLPKNIVVTSFSRLRDHFFLTWNVICITEGLSSWAYQVELFWD
jgi:hypothetical protein